MTGPLDDRRPRWARKLSKDTKTDPEIGAMYKVVGILVLAIIIWTIVARL